MTNKTEDKNALGEAIQLGKELWRERPGNEIPATIQTTLEALYPGLRPKIKHVRKDGRPGMFERVKARLHKIFPTKKSTASAYELEIDLPPGLSFRDLRNKENFFADALGGSVQFEKRGKEIIMTVAASELANSYPYQWDFSKFKSMALPVPFGYSASGLIVRDIAKAPNIISAGHPGAGKSTFLQVLITSLLLSREIYLVVVDFKEVDFNHIADLGLGLLVNDIPTARRTLEALNKELDRRKKVMKNHKPRANHITKVKTEKNPYIVLIIDELAEMLDEECQTKLNRLLRLGRAEGFIVVCATQRPSSTMFQKFGDSKAMFAASVCYHVRDRINSEMVLDNDRASLIPNIPGRGVYQWEIETEIQTMKLEPEEAEKILRDANIKGGIFQNDVIESPKRLPPRQGNNRGDKLLPGSDDGTN